LAMKFEPWIWPSSKTNFNAKRQICNLRKDYYWLLSRTKTQDRKLLNTKFTFFCTTLANNVISNQNIYRWWSWKWLFAFFATSFFISNGTNILPQNRFQDQKAFYIKECSVKIKYKLYRKRFHQKENLS
jgi:hypothetical protein